MKPLIAFLITAIICAFIAWLGGYDFDHRGDQVALGFIMSFFTSLVPAGLAFILEHT